MTRVRNLALLVTMIMAAVGAGSSPRQPGTPGVVGYAKNIDVHRLDPTLQPQALEDWLRRWPALGSVRWRVSNCCDCDLDDGGICVKFMFANDGVDGSGMLWLGTRSAGLAASPRLVSLDVQPFGRGAALSELPKLVSKEVEILDYAKAIDVSQLDAELPSQRLDVWLRKGPAHFEKLTWRVSDCDLKDDPELSLCVKVAYARGNVSGYALIHVGRIPDGIVAPPWFDFALVSMGNITDLCFDTAERPSELPSVVNRFLSPGRQ
jgi:hypothetical protein